MTLIHYQASSNFDDVAKLNVYILSGFKEDFTPFLRQNNLLDSIVEKIIAQRNTMSYEEQCSGKYYFDCFNAKFAEIGVKYSSSTQPAYAGQTYFIDNHAARRR